MDKANQKATPGSNAEAIDDESRAADLARLQALAVEDEAGAPGAVEVAPPDMAGELAALVTALVAIASPVLPSLGRIYTTETTNAACAAVAAVCEKHGWLQGGFMAEWGVEVAAAVVIVPLAVATVQGVKGDIAENAAREKRRQGEAAKAVEGPAPSPFGAFASEPAAPTFGKVIPVEGGAVENQ